MKLKTGDLVMVEFLDHAIFIRAGETPNTDPVKCILVGFVAEDAPTHYKISSWISEHINNPDTDIATVVKHPGIKVTRLVPSAKVK